MLITTRSNGQTFTRAWNALYTNVFDRCLSCRRLLPGDIPSLSLQTGGATLFGVAAPITQDQQQRLAILNAHHHRTTSNPSVAAFTAASAAFVAQHSAALKQQQQQQHHQHQQQQQQQQFPATFTTSPQMSTMQVPSQSSRLSQHRHSVPSSPHASLYAAQTFDFRNRSRLSPGVCFYI